MELDECGSAMDASGKMSLREDEVGWGVGEVVDGCRFRMVFLRWRECKCGRRRGLGGAGLEVSAKSAAGSALAG
jgi:hypothetical protein